MVMPFIVKALMEKHARREPYRLYERREPLVRHSGGGESQRRVVRDSLHYPL